MGIKLFSNKINAKKVSGAVTALGSTLQFSTDTWAMPDLTEGGTLDVNLVVDEGPEGYNYVPHLVRTEVTATGFLGEYPSTSRWDASDHYVTFIHNWGDPGERFTVPEYLEETHRDRNESIGPVSAHIYRKAGSYNYHVLAFDREGNYGYAKAVFTVKANDFNETETVVIAADGDFTGCPTSFNKFMSLAELNSWPGGGTGQKCKVYLKRGQQHEILDSLKQRDYFIAPWGKGDAPKIVANKTVTMFKNVIDPIIRLSEISFKGPWDAINDMALDRDSGEYKPGLSILQTISNNIDFIMDRCVERNMSLSLQLQTDNGRICVHETDRSEWRDFRFLGYGENLNYVWVGNKEVQNVNAANGTLSRDQFVFPNVKDQYLRNSHNGSRIPYARTVVATHNDLFARHGWTLQNIFYDNSILRLMTTIPPFDTTNTKFKYVINRNVMESSFVQQEASGAEVGMPPVSAVVEQNTFMSVPTVRDFFGSNSCGWTFRDNKFQSPNLPSVPGGAGPTRKFIVFKHGATYNLDLDGDGVKKPEPISLPENDTIPNFVYNNTFIFHGEVDSWNSPTPHTYQPVIFESHQHTHVFNNINYAPNVPNPLVSDGPINMSQGFTPRYLGLKRGYEYWRDYHVLEADILPNESVLLPYGPDWYGNPTTAETFAGNANRHVIELDTEPSFGVPSAIKYSPIVAENAAFAFEADGIRVTNLSADTWAAGMYVTLNVDRGDQMMEMDSTWATPPETSVVGSIGETSGAYQDADTSEMVSMMDFYGRIRPGTGYKDAPDGLPSRGAIEPA